MLSRCAFVYFLIFGSAAGARMSRKQTKKAGTEDCDAVDVRGFGKHGGFTQYNGTDEEGKMVFVFHSDLSSSGAYPVIVFSHGATAEWAMYEDSFRRYVSHGFVVIFPHIDGPVEDTGRPLDPMGVFTTKGVNYARSANADTSLAFSGKLDLANILLVGHSMGATSSIMAAHKLPAGSVKMAFALHPGICGPWGPPPCLPGACGTWMPNDFIDASTKVPLLMSTATNDAAFWPTPLGAKHLFGCFNKSTRDESKKKQTAFLEFSEEVCNDGEGGRYDRTWKTGGHDCPLKSNNVHTPWVVVASKLYGQLGGSPTSSCYAMLWGSGADSMRSDPALVNNQVNP